MNIFALYSYGGKKEGKPLWPVPSEGKQDFQGEMRTVKPSPAPGSKESRSGPGDALISCPPCFLFAGGWDPWAEGTSASVYSPLYLNGPTRLLAPEYPSPLLGTQVGRDPEGKEEGGQACH